MQELSMRIGGRVVSYPQAATFVIDQRKQGTGYKLLAHKADISTAVAKFNKSDRPGLITRLSAVFNGKLKPLCILKNGKMQPMAVS